MIKKLNLDIFVEDNWDIAKYLKNQNSKLKTGKKTKIFWIYNLLDRNIKYRYKFSSLKEVIKKIS
jgi:cytochrome c